MRTGLPDDVPALMQWSWPQMEPYYHDLEGRSLGPASVAEFLGDWTALNECIDELESRLYIATTVNTADTEAERRYRAFLDAVEPNFEAAEQRLRQKFLSSGLEPAGMALPVRKMRAAAELFREENLPLFTEESKLSLEYNKIIGAQTVLWEGQETTLSQLTLVYQDRDRARREAAWRLAAERQLADRPAIDDLWRRYLDLRVRMAANAGFPDYRAFRWQQRLRFDYTPDDCRTFHRAIEEVVVPAAMRVYERRRQRLGLKTLRPWDLDVDPLDRPPLAPFGDVGELKARVGAIFYRVDPQLGDYFATMVRENLLDLENRKDKAPGAYSMALPMSRRPFIFQNAVGRHDDVATLLHESGHAFHAFERFRLPYFQQRPAGAEMHEVASMAMELLASPYLAGDQGGFYSAADAARARVEHLERSILFWPYMAVVDAFQHWVYENPRAAMDPANCDACWGSLWGRFMPGVDWSGLEEEMKTGWHRKRHIHNWPFYYVEYGLAQLGAVQVWDNALQDQAGAVARYRQALALGGTVSLPELYATAGARFAFDATTLHRAVDLMEGIISALERS